MGVHGSLTLITIDMFLMAQEHKESAKSERRRDTRREERKKERENIRKGELGGNTTFIHIPYITIY